MNRSSANSKEERERAIRAVTFDFWATLYDNGPDMAPRYLELLGEAVPDVSRELLRPALDKAQKIAGDIGKKGFRLLVEARLAIILDELNMSLLPEGRDRLVNAFETAILDSPPNLIEGAPEVLDSLRGAGYKLALISDTGMAPGRVIRQLMERDGIAHFFQYFTFSDELGVNKRRRQPFLSTCEALGVAPREALHVGDLPETDIRNGKASGLRTALATYVSKRYDGARAADIVLEKLTDLPTVLSGLRA